jgi:hypothetical protein
MNDSKAQRETVTTSVHPFVITPFEDATFVVLFTGEGACSTLIKGWDSVLQFIDDQLQNEDFPDASVRSPCCDLHDDDNWTHGRELVTDDTRLAFSKSEFAYCVGLEIIRVIDSKA